MEQAVRALFERYQSFFAEALAGDLERDDVASLYAPEFIAATPAGVVTGKNDDALIEMMTQGYEHYRAIGTKGMRIRGIRVSSIDALHCVAHVAWTATYERDDLPRTDIDFDVHYLVQLKEDQARVFGWVSGEEQALLEEFGVV